ncbi:MRG-domain-containing protein, partial [Neoconidiobolus thromboides FSU 785]
FGIGENLLCYHGPLLYEAKQQDHSEGSDQPGVRYRVHYKGWKSRWDEWVPTSRILKLNEKNLEKQNELKEIVTNPNNPKKNTKAKSPKPFGPVLNIKRKESINGTEAVEDQEVKVPSPPVPKIKIELDIPDPLKLFLVDQWDCITRGQKLVPLPRKPSVRQILDSYRVYAIEKSKKENLFKNIINEIIDGLALYFVKTVGSFLLYRFERAQHKDPSRNDFDLLDIYGAEHLIRLFVHLPFLLSHAEIEVNGLKMIQIQLNQLL